jgi:hypothetical protein
MCDFNPRKSRVKVTAVISRGNLPQYFYNTGSRRQDGSQICFSNSDLVKNHKIAKNSTTAKDR